MAVMRIGHVSLRVNDLEAARRHYHDVVGLVETHRDADGTTYYKAWDEWDRYSLILSKGIPGLNHAAYKVESDEDLDRFAKRIDAWGIAVEELSPGTIPFVEKALRFRLPSSQSLVLYSKKDFVGKGVGTTNPDPWPDDIHGCGVLHLDHTLFVGELSPPQGVNHVADSARFFQQALGFQLTEQIVAGPGNSIQAAAFLSCSSKPHDIAFVPGQRDGFHHLAYFLDSWHDVLRAADIMSKHKVKIDVGPTRHGITRGQTIYFFDPSGNRNETFAGLGYFVSRDMPVVTWTEDRLGQAIFYPTREVNEAFSSVYTEAA
jgi:catechol 2,3-dioxygenase